MVKLRGFIPQFLLLVMFGILPFVCVDYYSASCTVLHDCHDFYVTVHFVLNADSEIGLDFLNT
jgi:hypothetical protein